jgi:hypothetical protein
MEAQSVPAGQERPADGGSGSAVSLSREFNRGHVRRSLPTRIGTRWFEVDRFRSHRAHRSNSVTGHEPRPWHLDVKDEPSLAPGVSNGAASWRSRSNFRDSSRADRAHFDQALMKVD